MFFTEHIQYTHACLLRSRARSFQYSAYVVRQALSPTKTISPKLISILSSKTLRLEAQRGFKKVRFSLSLDNQDSDNMEAA